MGIEPEDAFSPPELIVALQFKSNYSVVAAVVDNDKHLIRLLEFQDSKFLVVVESLLLQVIPEPTSTPGQSQSQTGRSMVSVEVFLGNGCEEIEKKLSLLLQLIEVRFCFQPARNHLATTEELSLLEYLLKEPVTFYVKKVQGLEDALGVACSICEKFRLIEDSTNHKTFSVKLIDLTEYMRLDHNAIQALGVLPKRESLSLSEKERDLSLLGIIDTCKTQMGPRTLRRWLLQPMTDRNHIEERLDLVEYLVMNEPIIHYITSSYLARVPDLEKIGVKFYRTSQQKKSKSSIADVVKVYQVVVLTNTAYFHLREQMLADTKVSGTLPAQSPQKSAAGGKGKPFASSSSKLSPESEALQSLLVEESASQPGTSLLHMPSTSVVAEQSRSAKPPAVLHRLARVVASLERCLKFFGNFVECVEKFVDLDQAKQGNYSLKEAASPQLAVLLKRRHDVYQKVQQFVRAIEADLEVDLGIEQDGSGAFLIRAPKKAEKKIGLGGYSCKFKLVTARATHMMLTCPELKKLSQEHAELDAGVFEEQQNAAHTVLEQIAGFYPAVEELGEFLGELDAVCAIARFSRSSLGRSMVRPNFNNGDRILMRKSRHPVLDKTLGSSIVPNDCEMRRGSSSFHIITGPNMGGKSTFIRQVAINILLAQIGSFCCAEYAELPIFDSIVTRVGAGDAQSKGLSTWMSELLEVSSMLETATARTFLVIDELGRGTSTSEGVGMTYAIAEHIIDTLGSFCLFATHYFELTSLEGSRPAAQNFHVEADLRQHSLEMSYQIKPGHTSKSFGVQVLSMLKFPSGCVQFADRLSGVLDQRSFLVQSASARRSDSSRGKLDEETKSAGPSLDTKVQFIKFSKQVLRQSHKSSAQPQQGLLGLVSSATAQTKISDRLRQKLQMLQEQES